MHPEQTTRGEVPLLLAKVLRLMTGHAANSARPVHALAFQFLRDHDGATVNALAEYLEITKQSVSELVANSEREGYVKRARNSVDARSSILRLTNKGEHRLASLLELWGEAEDRWAACIGRKRFMKLQNDLKVYLKECSTDGRKKVGAGGRS